MLGHRENSEGLRRRAIAPGGGASRAAYIVLSHRPCQPFGGCQTPCEKPCGSWRNTGNFCRSYRTAKGRREGDLRRTAATFLRRSLGRRVGCRHKGKATAFLTF